MPIERIGGIDVTKEKCPKFSMNGKKYHITLHQEKKHVTLEKPDGKDEAHYFFKTEPESGTQKYIVTGYKEPKNHNLDELKDVSPFIKANYGEILTKAFDGSK